MTAVFSADPATGCRTGRVRQRHPPRLSRLRRAQPARPVLRVPGVLRPARGRLRVPDDHPGRDRSRPEVDLAVRAAAAGAGRHRHLPLHRPRLHPAGRRPPPGRRPRPAAAVGQGRLGQPDPLVQGPGRRRRPVGRPRARSAGAGLPVDRQPGQRRRRRRRPGRHQVAWSSCRENLEQQKIIASAVYDTTLVAVARHATTT